MTHSASVHASASTMMKACATQVVASAKSASAYLYGDESRTHRTLCFAYSCIALYMLAIINAPSFGTCAL